MDALQLASGESPQLPGGFEIRFGQRNDGPSSDDLYGSVVDGLGRKLVILADFKAEDIAREVETRLSSLEQAIEDVCVFSLVGDFPAIAIGTPSLRPALDYCVGLPTPEASRGPGPSIRPHAATT
jgi:hypothetical protein